MHTVTKKELIDRIAEQSKTKRVIVKDVLQRFLDEIINELGRGNRMEFRDFGVFETKRGAANGAEPQDARTRPRALQGTVKFKVGRLMKQRLAENFKPIEK